MKIVITLDGGTVQNIYTDSDKEIEVEILDYDRKYCSTEQKEKDFMELSEGYNCIYEE